MKKKLIFVMCAMLLMLAGTMITACSSEDATPEIPETGNGTRQMPNQADFIKTMTDVGYLKCDKVDNTWYIDAPYHGEQICFDGGNMFYLYDLPEEYKKENLKVQATLDCYTFHHFDEQVEIIIYAGYDYYDAVLREIKIAE